MKKLMLVLSLFAAQAAVAMGPVERVVSSFGDIWNSGKTAKAGIIATSAATAATLYKMRHIIARGAHNALPDRFVSDNALRDRRAARQAAQYAQETATCNTLLQELRNDSMTLVQFITKSEEFLNALPRDGNPELERLIAEYERIIMNRFSQLLIMFDRLVDVAAIHSSTVVGQAPIINHVGNIRAAGADARIRSILDALRRR